MLLLLGLCCSPLVAAFGSGVVQRPALPTATKASQRAGTVEAGLLNALRKLRKVEQKPPIAVGAKLPDVDVEVCLSSGLAEAAGVAEEAAEEGAPDRITLSLVDAIGDKKTILLGMPGAFTPTCTDLHLPGFIRAEDSLEKQGVEQIALLTTNDVYVNLAWIKNVEECTGAGSTKIAVISDGDGDAVKELGLAADMGFGMGTRAKRFTLLLDEGVVKHVAVDEGMEELSNTSAEAIGEVLPVVFPATAAVAKAEEQQKTASIGLAVAALTGAAYYYYTTSGGGA